MFELKTCLNETLENTSKSNPAYGTFAFFE